MKLNSRSPFVVFFCVFLAALLGCAIGCTVAFQFFMGGHQTLGGHDDGHDWLHEQLGITDAQKEELHEIEEKFAKQEEKLREAIATGNNKLGVALKEDEANTPRVQVSVKEIHHYQAQLQNATIDHLLEMKEVLTPAQFKQLLELSGKALSGF